MLCPEWTEADFAQAKTSKDIPAYVRSPFFVCDSALIINDSVAITGQ
jgi:hypothetical protein